MLWDIHYDADNKEATKIEVELDGSNLGSQIAEMASIVEEMISVAVENHVIPEDRENVAMLMKATLIHLLDYHEDANFDTFIEAIKSAKLD